MPTWLAIVIGVIVLVIVLLAVGGYLANRRARAAGVQGFEAHLRSADHDLAAAHAADKGWAPDALEAAARAAWAERHPGEEPGDVELVQVIDRAGTDEDKAVFAFAVGEDRRRLTLRRTGDDWALEHLE